jgi:hypothetical protein
LPALGQATRHKRFRRTTRLAFALPRLPAVGDNSAMQPEPPKADPPKRKRRWFQFSLRTLMIVVALLAVPMGYVGWQAKIVRERTTLLIESGKEMIGGDYLGDDDGISRIRRLFGDRCWKVIILYEAAPTELRAKIKAAFPESSVWIVPSLTALRRAPPNSQAIFEHGAAY